jgi:hypothetical protein
MELLKKMIQDIALNYGLKFIVEQITFDYEIVYRLKQRKEIRIAWHSKLIDNHELNYHGNIINFKSCNEMCAYLKFRFSEREGFLNRINDIELNSIAIEATEFELIN